MGEEKTFKCPKCGNVVKLNDGLGMMWSSFDKSMFYRPKNSFDINFYDELDKKMIDEVHRFIEESQDVLVADAYYQPYICKRCGKMESKLYFKIYGNDKTYIPKYFCECGNRYKKLTEKEQEHLHCDKCGTEMIKTNSLFWD